MEELYSSILDGLRNSGHFYDSELHGTFEKYLQSLQEPTRKLRQAYRNDSVTVDYSSPEVQAAYLICYYPHYVEMSLEVFRLLTTELSHKEEIYACFFGSGPCPELVALVQFLREHSEISHWIQAKSFDILANEWSKSSRDVTLKYVIPPIKPEWWGGRQSQFYSYSLDFCAEECVKDSEIEESIRQSNLFVFQNCLNEVQDKSTFLNNIEQILELSPSDSLLLLIDLQYNQNRDIKLDILRRAENRSFSIIQNLKDFEIRSSLVIPSIITQNLLTGESGLIPRSRIKFSYIGIKKSGESNRYFDEILF